MNATIVAIEQAALGMIMAAVLLTMIRVAVGPTLADRVLALDLMALLAVGLIGAYAIVEDQPNLLDPALVLALLAFLATVAFARYLARRSPR